MKIKWLRTFLKFFLYYYLLEKLSLGDEATVTSVTLYSFLILLVRVLMAQPILQTPGLLKGNGRLEDVIDQIQDQTVK